ncbi:UNVERIFIED_ORG: hypothetical protein FHR35_008785 [Microbispora rosea subsp. rosea]
MITVRMNGAAAEALGFPDSGLGLAGVDAADPQRLLLGGGIVRDDSGALFAPGYSHELSPHRHTDLTGVECDANSRHLDDHPDVAVSIDHAGRPRIGRDHRIHMLRQGIVLSGIVHTLARRLPDRPPVRCITATDETNGTFRFHQIRPGEEWLRLDDLDGYADEMIVVIDAVPPDRDADRVQPNG